MENSILISIKKLLGIEPEYTHFDPDIIIHINSALMALQQLGVGPETSFFITSKDDTWESFLGNRTDIESVKLFVYLKARTIFDPPSNSFVLDAFERQIRELEWRLNVQVDKGEEAEDETG